MGLGLRTFAAMLDCSPASVSLWERGMRTPSAYWLYRIERALSYPRGYLASRVGKRPRGRAPKEETCCDSERDSA